MLSKNLKKKKRNTLNLKYQVALEEASREKDKVIKLQDKIIALQEDNDIYQKYIIEELEKDIVQVKLKFKKLKEKNNG